MDSARKDRLSRFVEYARSLAGDEKGEAQVFLDRLFIAFGHEGYHEAGAKLEYRVRNNRLGTSFADLVWKPTVLIEMKRRGAELSLHLAQAFEYWIRLVPNRPKYVILCNFNEIRVYDFDQDINQPLDSVLLSELPERFGLLNFLFKIPERPVFQVDREKVTRQAAAKLAAVYKRLRSRRDIPPETAQRFVLQALVCLFSEDIGLLPRHFFTQLLEDCINPPKAFDLLDGLFRAMNRPTGASGGRFRDVQYFNGGIFSESAAIELDPAYEIAYLKEAASYRWEQVSPDIFGTIFQQSLTEDQRHAFGAHYTMPSDILKIVRPTIVQPFEAAIDQCETLAELRAIRSHLQRVRVLDPACGSGNFLYIAYREMRRLEAFILKREIELFKRLPAGQMAFGGVSPKQFFGMDILPFAVELAKVTLAIAPQLASDELHTEEKTLPLYNLDENIRCRDALIDESGNRPTWPEADIIIGNPPFLGAKRLKPERGSDYVNAIRDLYPEIPGMADYCVYWIRRSHDHLRPCTADEPFTGRAGLVGTQNIRNNQSRVGGLDHVAATGTIVEAVENMPWSGEANVHVSIANWVKNAKSGAAKSASKSDDTARLLPRPRRIWSKVDSNSPEAEIVVGEAREAVVTRGSGGRIRRDKSYELTMREVTFINSMLSDTANVSSAEQLSCNLKPHVCFQGVVPGYKEFLLSNADRIRTFNNEKVVRPFMVGRDMLTDGRPSRSIIDFADMELLDARRFIRAFEHVTKHVLPAVRNTAMRARPTDMAQARADHLERWWQFWNVRIGLRRAIKPLKRFLACARVTKRPVFVYCSTKILPDGALQCFAFDDDYSFGVLQSNAHWQWFVAKCSKLTERFRYTPESVFNTFPWPQAPSKKQVWVVASAGRAVRHTRDKALRTVSGGLRALYRTLELPGKNPLKDAHAELDAAVLHAYGFSYKKDLLAQLLELNLAVAAQIEEGNDVTAPGVPASYGKADDLVTDDCIQP